MRVALIVLQLRVAEDATQEGVWLGVERAFGHGSRTDWPPGCDFYFIGEGRRLSRVKRVRFVDIPEVP